MLLWLVGCAHHASPPPSCGEAATEPSYATYAVEGTTREQVRSSLAAHAPGAVGDADAVGVTDVHVTTACTDAIVDGVRSLKSVHADVEIAVTVPSWTPPSSAAPDVVADWRTFDAATRRHEDGHVAIAQKWTTCLDAYLATAATCADANDRLMAVERAMQSAQDAYDARTDHGVRQGTTF